MEIKKANIKFSGKLKNRKNTRNIILHCSATPEGRDYTVEQIHSWHLQKGWVGIGYHYIITRDGTIYQGRPDNTIGAHCTNYNSTSIGICYVGGMDADNKHPKDTRTIEQKQALLELVQYLMDKYHITLDNVRGHYELCPPNNHKACPCFKIHQFREEYLNFVNKKL